MKKIIISGIVNPRSCPKSPLKVTMILVRDSGATNPTRIPRTIPRNNLIIKRKTDSLFENDRLDQKRYMRKLLPMIKPLLGSVIRRRTPQVSSTPTDRELKARFTGVERVPKSDRRLLSPTA